MQRTLPLALLALAGCSANWGWYVVDPSTKSGWTNLAFLLSGLKYTVALSLTAIVVSVTLGLLVALPGLSANPWLRRASRTYVELVRAVPILVLILWVYYGLPQLAGLTLSVFWAGVLALALSDSAFEAERSSAPGSSRSRAASTRRHGRSRSTGATRCASSSCRRRSAASCPRLATSWSTC